MKCIKDILKKIMENELVSEIKKSPKTIKINALLGKVVLVNKFPHTRISGICCIIEIIFKIN